MDSSWQYRIFWNRIVPRSYGNLFHCQDRFQITLEIDGDPNPPLPLEQQDGKDHKSWPELVINYDHIKRIDFHEMQLKWEVCIIARY